MKRLLIIILSTAALTVTAGPPRIAGSKDGPFEMRIHNFESPPIPNFIPSPDGNFVLYQRRGPGPTQIIIKNVVTDRERILAALAPKEILAIYSWSPNGKYIAFNTFPSLIASGQPAIYSEIRLITVETGEIKNLTGTGEAREYSWSPDSRYLAMLSFQPASNSHLVRLAAIRTDEVKTIGSASPWADFTWSPDSSRLAYLVRQGSGPDNNVHIYTIADGERKIFSVPKGIDGRTMIGTLIPPLPVTPGYRSSGFRSMSGSGWTTRDQIVFSTIQGSTFSFRLMKASTGISKEICSELVAKYDSACNSISPDGAFEVISQLPTRRLILRDIEAGTERPIMKKPSEENYLLSSPDARLVAFASNREGDWGLYVAPIDRGPVENPVRVATLNNSGEKLAGWWTPDGRIVLGFRIPVSSIYKLAVDKESGHALGEPRNLITDSSEGFAPGISPDGAHIAYWAIKGEKRGLAVMNANGEQRRFLMDYPVSRSTAPQLGWRSNNEVLFYDAAPNGNPGFSVVDIGTGQFQKISKAGIVSRKWAYVPESKEIISCPSSGSPTAVLPLNALEAAVFSDLGFPEDSVPRSPLKRRLLIDGPEETIAGMDEKADVALSFAVSSDNGMIAYLHTGPADLDALGKKIRATMPSVIPLEIRLISTGGRARTLLKFPDFRPQDSIRNNIPEPQSFSPDKKFLLYTNIDGRPCVADTMTGNNWILLNPYIDWWKDAHWSKDGSVVLTYTNSRIEWKSWGGVTYDAIIKMMASQTQ